MVNGESCGLFGEDRGLGSGDDVDDRLLSNFMIGKPRACFGSMRYGYGASVLMEQRKDLAWR